MPLQLFPFVFFDRTFNNFDDVVYHINRSVWLYQIGLGLVYCACTRRFLPDRNYKSAVPSRAKHALFLKQINVYFLTAIVVYSLEMSLSTPPILVAMFERFLHHICAILLIVATLVEQHILCFHYVLPLFLHSLYW